MGFTCSPLSLLNARSIASTFLQVDHLDGRVPAWHPCDSIQAFVSQITSLFPCCLTHNHRVLSLLPVHLAAQLLITSCLLLLLQML